MATAITIGGSPSKGKAAVGRQLDARTVPLKWPRSSVRWKFATRFRQLTSEMDIPEIKAVLQCSSEDMARKVLRGDRTPHIDDWPQIAKKLGLKSWLELLSDA